jgi:hypothetical protein
MAYSRVKFTLTVSNYGYPTKLRYACKPPTSATCFNYPILLNSLTVMTQSSGEMRNSSFSSLCESAWKLKLLGPTSIYDRGPVPQQKAGAQPSSKDAIRSAQYYGVTSNSIKSRRYHSHRGAFFSQCLDRTHITAVGEVAARPGAGVKLGLNRT